MDQFLQLPNQLLQLKDPLAVLTYAIIDNQKTLFPFNKQVEFPLSYISYNKMEDTYGISKKTAIKAVGLLKEAGLINYKQLPTGRDKQLYNEYSFPLISKVHTKMGTIAGFRSLYKEVDSKVLKLELSSKEKGILLMLYILSVETGEIIMSEAEIAEALGISNRTLNKYFILFLSKGLLFKGRYHYSLIDHSKDTTSKLTITL
jgi:biotin operon repressor